MRKNGNVPEGNANGRMTDHSDDKFVIPDRVRQDYAGNPALLEKLERMARQKPAHG